jgi:hypothetical protein
MAVLGVEGRVRLRRDAPAPLLLSSSTLRADIDKFVLNTTDYWSGDEVYLYAGQGLPIAGQCANGVAAYRGGYWDVGPNRAHIADDDDKFYQTDNAVKFYCGIGQQSGEYFIHRDTLNRMSLHTDYCSAVNGGSSSRVDLAQYNFGTILLAPAGTADYNNALAECYAAAGDYRVSDVRDEITLESICKFAPEYESPTAGTAEYDDADLEPRSWVGGFPWVIQCQLKEWSLDLDASAVDTSQVGEKFGENVKSIVTGGGTFDFFIGEAKTGDGIERRVDPSYLMKLLLITDRGAKADAEFRLMAPKELSNCGNSCSPLGKGNLLYRTQLLITKIAVNVRATELIVGSAAFVTSGEIAINFGSD